MADLLVRNENEIAEDGENALIAQTRASDKARIAVVTQIMRGVIGPELAQAQASGLTIAEGFYINSASGDLLRKRLADFGLVPRAAGAAWTTVRFTRATGVGELTIPDNTQLRALDADGNALDFRTRDEAVMAANENVVDVVVDAEETGTTHNVGSDTITTIPNAIPGLADGDVTVNNLKAVTSGRAADSDAEARALFFAWLDARTRATPAGLKYGALSYTETGDDDVVRYPVLSASVEEHLEDPGAGGRAVTLYAVGHNGEMLTATQKTGVQERIDGYVDVNGQEVEGWRAAGILVVVTDPALVAVDVSLIITLSERGSTATLARLEADLEAKIAALPIGSPLKVTTIYGAVHALGDEVANMQLLAPVADVPASVGQKLVLGSLTVAGA